MGGGFWNNVDVSDEAQRRAALKATARSLLRLLGASRSAMRELEAMLQAGASLGGVLAELVGGGWAGKAWTHVAGGDCVHASFCVSSMAINY